MPIPEFESIRARQRKNVLWLTLDRQHRANAIDLILASEMLVALDHAESDPTCRAVVVTGAGRHFCGGVDLRATEVSSSAVMRIEFIDKLAQSPLPTIAGINGAAIGGGFEIALACDFRLMSSTAEIGLPEVRFGGLPGQGGTQRTARLAGASVAKQLVMIGEPLAARRAAELGLVEEVVQPGDLYAACSALADKLVRRPAFALAAAKRAIDEGLDMTLAAGLAHERVTVRQDITPEMRRAAQAQAAAEDAVYARIFTVDRD